MRLVLAITLFGGAGCSWFTALAGGYEPPCSKRYVAPIADTVVALASAVGCTFPVADLALYGDGEGDSPVSPAIVCVPLVPLAIMYGLSARHGFVGERRCR